jgi:hypothetical protein
MVRVRQSQVSSLWVVNLLPARVLPSTRTAIDRTMPLNQVPMVKSVSRLTSALSRPGRFWLAPPRA